MARPSDTTPARITAAILVIGDEILSGRTKDANIGVIADHLIEQGIDLKEVRIVPDEEAGIIAALNALRTRYAYVFTDRKSTRLNSSHHRLSRMPSSA